MLYNGSPICFPLKKFNSDDVPTSSRLALKRSTNKNFKKSPLKAGYINKFQKIRDDKAKKLVKRSKLIIQDINRGKTEGNRSHLNKSLRKKLKSPKYIRRHRTLRVTKDNDKKKDVTETAEGINKPNETKNAMDSDNDCVLVEKSTTIVTIEDDDDDDDDSDSDSSSGSNNDNTASTSGYQSLFQSFSHGLSSSSTPCVNKAFRNANANAKPENTKAGQPHHSLNANSPLSHNHSRPSYAYMASKNIMNNNNPVLQQNAPFFVDVSGKAYLGNVKYNTRVPLKDKIGCDDDVVIIDDDSTLYTKNSTLKKPNENSSSSSESSTDDSSSEEEEGEEGEIVEDKSKSAALPESGAADDSVVFVSETNKNDFIPINGVADTNVRKTPYTAAAAPRRTPMYSELFTKSEKKQMEAYNRNAYNPNAGEEFKSKKRMVVIDGSNVAFKHSLDKGFSVKGLKIAIEYFERLGHEVKAVIPQYRMNNTKSTDPAEMDRLNKSGKLIQTPCKNIPGFSSTSYDDRFILQVASETDAAVISNDNYRDLIHENPAFKKIIESRVIGYTWCNDIFMLPKDPYGKWGPTLDMILNRS